MAQKDITEKTLEAYNDVFADIVNVLLFKGEQLIVPASLTDASPTSMYKMDGEIHEQERDVAKYWHNNNMQIAFYGFENQTQIDKDMPLRVLNYDGAAYRHQLNLKKELASGEQRNPVVTLILYFGKSPWRDHQRLLECLNIPEPLKPYVSDYKLNIFDISQLSLEQVALFKSDFKIVAEYFVQKRLFKNYTPSKLTLKHVDEVLKLMSILTQDKRFEDSINEFSERSDANMCEILDNMIANGEAKGLAKGDKKRLLIDIRSLMQTLNLSPQKAMEALKVPKEQQAELLLEI